jgi:tetratricopeptide (TPR) repeat protein
VLYRRALTENPKWTEGWWCLGTILYDRDDYSGAEGAFEKTSELDPSSGAALVMLGLSEERLHDDGNALKHLRSGRKLGIADYPQLHTAMLFTLATLCVERGVRGDFEEAQEALDTLAREGVDSDDVTDTLGMAVLHVRPPPNDQKMIHAAGRAETLAARRQPAEARKLYEELASDYPKVSGIQFALGKFLVATYRDDEAVAAFQREIENTPDHLLARLGIAGIKLNSDPAGGLRYAREAVKIAPELPEAHYLLGVTLMNTGEPLRAIAELEIAQRGEPNEPKVYFALGSAYAKMNRKEDAARARATFTRLNAKGSHE